MNSIELFFVLGFILGISISIIMFNIFIGFLKKTGRIKIDITDKFKEELKNM